MSRAALTCLVFLAGCGGDSDSGARSLTIDYQLFKRGANVGCDQATEVREIEVTLFGADEITPRLGWPRKSTCGDSFIANDVEPGEYTLQVVATGELHGDSAAVLYKARSRITVPTGPLSLSLEPEVAFLDLAWTFGSDMLAPCATEVQSIDVLVASGRGDPYTARVPCQATPHRIVQPFALQSYAIQVTANSAEGFPLFTADAQRTLERGLNEHNAVLAPRGGRVLIDFVFFPGDVMTRMCDDDGVHASEITAVIRSREGGQTARETFSCLEERPYAFRSARFTQGRLLTLELIAEADARFKGVQSFTMPGGDYTTGIVTMIPVGSATVSVEVASSTCAVAADRFDVTARHSADARISFEASIEPPATSVSLIDLPYGSWQVEVVERANGAPICTADGTRRVASRENDWDPFVF